MEPENQKRSQHQQFEDDSYNDDEELRRYNPEKLEEEKTQILSHKLNIAIVFLILGIILVFLILFFIG